MKNLKLPLAVFVAFVLAFVFLTPAALAFGETGTTADNFKWEVLPSNSAVRITGYDGAAPATLNIPATVDTGLSYGTLPVTEIAPYAFFNSTSITVANIPENVTLIGSDAFIMCVNLTSISLPSTLTEIGPNAFYFTNLTSLTIPDNVTTIGSAAFFNTDIPAVTLPAALSSLGVDVFGRCLSLTSIAVKPGNLHFASVDGVLYNQALAKLICYPGGLHGAFTIPAGVDTIGESAFLNCQNLTGITIPEGVTTIELGGFYGCTGLTSIVIPEGIVTINPSTFYNCTNLSVVSLPESLENIRTGAFYNCYALTTIELPAGVTQIGNDVFGRSGMSRFVIYSDTAIFGESVFINTNIADDGIYGNTGSSAESYASANSYPFTPLLALTSTPADGNISTGESINITPNITGGSWDFDSSVLTQSGNVFTALKSGSTRVKNTVGWQERYIDVTVTAVPITGLPATYSMYTGGRVTWDPKPDGGTWDWDEEFFSAEFNSPATFTARKAGTSTITYLNDGVAQSVTVSIRESQLPTTGQYGTTIYIFIGIATLAFSSACFLGTRKKKRGI